MNKWEYKILDAYTLGSSAPYNDGVLQNELDKLGREGWEAYGCQYPRFYFKRPELLPRQDPLGDLIRARESEWRQTQALCRDNPGPYKETRGRPQ